MSRQRGTSEDTRALASELERRGTYEALRAENARLTGEANAKLIAAAPAMADALEEIVIYRNGTNDPRLAALLEDAHAALRAAGRLP